MMKVGITIVLLMILEIVTVQAQDSQWRGPGRNGKYTDTGLLKEWPKEGPQLILQKEGLGRGLSTPIFYLGHVYISGKRDDVDILTKINMQGNILWETQYGNSWNQSYPESRGTPTIEKGRIYIMGGMGTVVCLDTESGKIIWKVNTHEEYKGEFHSWGMAESLLVTPNMAVISSPVGSRTAMVALDKKTDQEYGKPNLWVVPGPMYHLCWSTTTEER